MGKEHILVVDDEETIRCLVFDVLSNANYEVTTVGTAEEALDVLSRHEQSTHKVDFLLTDFNLPGLSGLNLIDELQRRGEEVPTIMMSGSSDETLRSAVIDRHCVGYITKPFTLSILLGEIGRCLSSLARVRKNEELEMNPAL